jgi:predicted ATPase/class 3 adenylate cyclase
MAAQPTGTVTLLFSDIEGSTRLLERLGTERYGKALELHRRLLRDAFAAHDGYEVGTEGDSFFVAFHRAEDAVAAAEEAQQAFAGAEWPDDEAIRVRMGLHTGEPAANDGNYVGIDVHRAARSMSAAHGGQVVVSATTRALVARAGLTELGEHRLKDFDEPVALFQLGPQRFPPLKTISNTNLPRPVSSFVGRQRERADVVELLQDGARLVTLSGPGGSGKTRLAIESATELVPAFRNGVFWISLATLRDPALVAETVAQTLGAKYGLAEHVGERELLLLLDNFEQVVEAAPELGSLLESCPNLHLLVTSRELLRIRGEVEYPVPSLAQSEAVELFCTRSQLARSDDIAELCRRLDDLPLAVELAAARTSALSPTQILERLSQRLDLLQGGRDAESRQQTLRATIEWSHDLLSREEQQLFAGMAVFAGGFTLEAAEAVCDADLGVLQSLVDKSLLRRTADRFWMLETIREFALERVHISGKANELRRKHAEFFLELGELARPELQASSSIWFDRVEAEQDNIRAALGDALEHTNADVALRLGDVMSHFWFTRGHWTEGRRFLESALTLGTESDPQLRVGPLWGAGLLALKQGDIERVSAVADELLPLSAETGSSPAGAVLFAALVAHSRGDEDDAAALYSECARLAREEGDARVVSIAVNNLGYIRVHRGEYALAVELFEESTAIGVERQDHELISRGSINLAYTALMLGELGRARSLLHDGLRAAREIGQMEGFIYGFLGLAAAYAPEDSARAARLLGRADMLLEETASPDLDSLDTRIRDQTEAELRTRLNEDAYAALYAEGRALALEDALTLALGPS